MAAEQGRGIQYTEIEVKTMQKSQQFLYQNYDFQQEQEFKEKRRNIAATHFLEYDKRSREYRPVPIPMYPRD